MNNNTYNNLYDIIKYHDDGKKEVLLKGVILNVAQERCEHENEKGGGLVVYRKAK